MNWYGIKLLFQAEHPDEERDKMFYQESVLLVNAENEHTAKEKAFKWGLDEEVNYENIHGKEVRWKFTKIIDVYQLPETEIKDCTEVYSSFFYQNSD